MTGVCYWFSSQQGRWDSRETGALTDATAMAIAFHLLPVAAYTGAATITP
jgi:hypothetical protein